jgi:site-specific DNA-cytosine methylase
LNVVENEKIWRKLTPIECERLQTVPDNYTLVPHPVYKDKMMSNSQRYKMLGNGWTVDVIVHIFKNIT